MFIRLHTLLANHWSLWLERKIVLMGQAAQDATGFYPNFQVNCCLISENGPSHLGPLFAQMLQNYETYIEPKGPVMRNLAIISSYLFLNSFG